MNRIIFFYYRNFHLRPELNSYIMVLYFSPGYKIYNSMT